MTGLFPMFRACLRDELQAAGLLQDAAAYERCRSEASEKGQAVEREVIRLVGVGAWERSMSRLAGRRAREDYRYVMGHGQLLSRFLTAPVPVPEERRTGIEQLAGVANLLVGYVDELVDAGVRRDDLLPPWVLRHAMRRRYVDLVRAQSLLVSAPARLVRCLAIEYFRRISELHTGGDATGRNELEQLILAMYDAEGRSPGEWGMDARPHVLRLKTAFPILVLGLPAWLAVPEPCCALRRTHVRWMRRLGQFIRWIDDAADLDLDAAHGAPNLVHDRLRRMGTPEASGSELARKIASRGHLLLEEWRELAAGTSGKPDRSEAFRAIITTWTGGPP